MQIEALTHYILTAMLSWTPIQNFTMHGEAEDHARARLQDIASDIASVFTDSNEAPVFSGPTGRVRSALLLASIGSFEGGWQQFVEEGDCNKTGYKADGRGSCDGGFAFTSWQIHIAGGGFLYVGGRLTNVTYERQYAKDHPNEIINGNRLVADRRIAVRVAKDLIIETAGRDCLLCGYAGESSLQAHPKADARLQRAKDYWARHPFVDPDADGRQASNP